MARDVTVARRYAQALFMAAQKKDVITRVGEELAAVQRIDHASGDRLRLFLEAPQVPNRQKLALVEAVLAPYTHRLVVEFFRLLLAKKRLFRLRDIMVEFEDLVEAHQGIVRAKVTSAVPLADPEVAALIASLEAGLSKKVKVEAHVDPAILGGLVVKVGDRIADRSVMTLLSRMRDQLLAASLSS
ncbi:MAG: ATP synthase F1 subunit delta [Candidatus Eisenbacteria bacterium]